MHHFPLTSPRSRPTPRTRNFFLTIPSPPTPIPTHEPTLKESLEALLNAIPQLTEKLFSEDGPLRALQFWRDNRSNIKQTTSTLMDTSESIVRGDSEGFRKNARRLDFRWLKPADGDTDFATVGKEFAIFALDALTPWDFDRHDFGLTFVTTWEDLDAGDLASGVKLTSTIKPLEGEWKASARSKLINLGKDTSVFGKAGIYLAGEHSAYIGVEADRVWKIPKLEGTKLFCNMNYRSSRKPANDPIRLSFGVQQDFELAKGVLLTLRIGAYPLEREKFFVTPVPNGHYF